MNYAVNFKAPEPVLFCFQSSNTLLLYLDFVKALSKGLKGLNEQSLALKSSVTAVTEVYPQLKKKKS